MSDEFGPHVRGLDELPDVLTPEECAEVLRRPLPTVWAMLRRGELPAAYVARRYRVLKKDLVGLFGASPQSPAERSSAPLTLPDRVPRLGRPGRPRKVRRRAVRGRDGVSEAPPQLPPSMQEPA